MGGLKPNRARYWARRLARHALIAASSGVAGIGCWTLIPSTDAIFKLSLTSAYVSLGLLAVTLVIGPLNLVRRRPNPTSTDLRRDFGIWTAIVATLHTFAGLQVHLRGKMWRYFLASISPPTPNLSAFGAANYAGLVATLLLLLLLAISNDLSLRTLGTIRWKQTQRWVYAAAVLIVGHGVLYQLVERRYGAYSVTLGAVTLAVALVQWRGYRMVTNGTRAASGSTRRKG